MSRVAYVNGAYAPLSAPLVSVLDRGFQLADSIYEVWAVRAGVPPAAGFFGKFFLFNAAVQADLTWLALVGILWSIVALYYYLVVIKVMYVDHGQNEDQPIAVQRPTVWALSLTAVAIILLGTFAVQAIYQLAAQGAASLFGAG